MLIPTSFKTKEEFHKALNEEGCKKGWKPYISEKITEIGKQSVNKILNERG